MPTTQVSFNRINPAAPPHLLGDDELQTAENFDFSLGQGALIPRRGCTVFGTVKAGTPVSGLLRIYNDANNIGAGPFYARTEDGTAWRGSGASWTALGSGAAGAQPFAANSYQQYMVMSDAGLHIKDDGTNATEWIKQSPGTPAITVSTLTPLDLFFGTGSFTVTEGTSVAGTTTITASPSAEGKVTLTVAFGGAKDLNTNGATIGDYGVHFVDLAFSNPALVTKISQDFSIGDDTFYNYWHAELSPQSLNFTDAQADPAVIVDAQTTEGNTTIPLSRTERERMISALRDNPRLTLSSISRITNTFAPWGVSRPEFSFVGSDPNAGGTSPWASIHAVRYTFELAGDVEVLARDPQIAGAEGYPLTDLDIGYSWWQTYATFNAGGAKIGESAPSPASSRVRMQNARALVALTGTATGTVHGVTHVITYRQGGYTRDAYAVSTASYTGTFTTTDTLSDLKALSLNYQMPRNITAADQFPGAVQAISPTWNDRVFFSEGNKLFWSLPGALDAFPLDGWTQVGPVGDSIKALIPWNPGLVLVNQYSVYEFTGQDLEQGQWDLRRSGSKHGCIPPRVPCLTPYGIPLLNYDGLTLYIPGQGEQELEWLMGTYGDIFRGGALTDPAARKNFRVPSINRGYILGACACYAENKLFLAAPTGTQQTNNTLFVIDFAQRRLWWYTYGFSIASLFWDHQDSRLFAGTTNGRIMQLETGNSDVETTGAASSPVFSARTRQWAAPTDSIFENVAVHAEGPCGIVQGFYDDPVSPIVGTLSGTRQWHHLPLSGSFARTAEFNFLGTASSTDFKAIYGLSFDHLQDPERIRYYRTPYDDRGTPNQKLWDAANYSIEVLGTALVRAVTFVDNVATMTHTVTGPTGGRVNQTKSFPAETYGKIAYTTYTSTDTAVLFKLWDGQDRFQARPEPPQVSSWRTDIQSLDEAICDAFDVDINPAGTVFGTMFVDNTAVATATYIGTSRQSYTSTIPVETYGRTLYVLYSGTNLKHYNTWFHRRDEPDRWTSFVSDKRSGDEHEWKVFKPEVVVYGGGTCTATVMVAGTAVSTHTMSNTTRLQHTFSIPYEAFGRTIWAIYNVSGGYFKPYSTEFEGTPEPPRVTTLRVGPFPLAAEGHFKTWVPELDPLGGTVVGTLYADGTAITTATFSGSGRQKFDVGVDLVSTTNIRSGRTWEARYAGAAQFKHYASDLDTDGMPYNKLTWAFQYKKLGGSSQIDLPRFWSLSYASDLANTCTYYWDIDGANHHSGTMVLIPGTTYKDRISFPYGGWGRLFQCRLQFSSPAQVDAVNMDFVQEGVKGLSRRGIQGDPRSG